MRLTVLRLYIFTYLINNFINIPFVYSYSVPKRACFNTFTKSSVHLIIKLIKNKMVGRVRCR